MLYTKTRGKGERGKRAKRCLRNKDFKLFVTIFLFFFFVGYFNNKYVYMDNRINTMENRDK